MKSQAPVKQLFVLVFALMIFYQLITRLPFMPEELLGLGFEKLVKIFVGLLFCAGSLLIYTRNKKSNHGSGR
ncbi:MAG: hypothetical protein ACLFUB_10490 [Cyclobacteriaceae bacterium]